MKPFALTPLKATLGALALLAAGSFAGNALTTAAAEANLSYQEKAQVAWVADVAVVSGALPSIRAALDQRPDELKALESLVSAVNAHRPIAVWLALNTAMPAPAVAARDAYEIRRRVEQDWRCPLGTAYVPNPAGITQPVSTKVWRHDAAGNVVAVDKVVDKEIEPFCVGSVSDNS